MDVFIIVFESRHFSGKADHHLLCHCGCNMLRNKGQGLSLRQKENYMKSDVLVINSLWLLFMTLIFSFSSFPDTPFHPLLQDIWITNPAFFSYLENPLCSFNICFIFILEALLCLTVVCMVAVSPEVEHNLPPHREIKSLFLNQILQWPLLEKHHLYLTMKLNQIPDIGLKDNNIKIAWPYTDGQMSRPLAACQFFLQPLQFWRQTGLSALRYLQCLIPSACASLEIRFTTL